MTTDKKFCSREDFKQVITSSYDAIFVTDGEGNVILCNPATGKMLNVEPKKLMGKNVRELVQKGIYDRSIVLEALRARAEATGLIINRDGKKVMSTAIPIFNANR